jgi:hypothetical protein
VTAHPHLEIQAFTLHLLLQRPQGLIDVVVANLNFLRSVSPLVQQKKIALHPEPTFVPT